MSALYGFTVANKVQKLLHDETGIRWTGDELIMWINSAQKEILIYKPNSLTKVMNLELIPGTLQKVWDKDATCIQVLDVIRNVGGNAVTNINREVLDATLPNWHQAAAGTPQHYVINPLDPKNFYVYPPVATPASGYIEILIAYEPTDIVSLGTIVNGVFTSAASSILAFDAIYESVIIDYVLYRAYGKDSEHTANSTRSKSHYDAFMTALKGKFTAETALAADAQFADAKQQPQQQK